MRRGTIRKIGKYLNGAEVDGVKVKVQKAVVFSTGKR